MGLTPIFKVLVTFFFSPYNYERSLEMKENEKLMNSVFLLVGCIHSYRQDLNIPR